MGAGCALSDVAARGWRAARAPAAGDVQRPALPRAPWRGAPCRTTCRPGRRFTTKRNAGCAQAALRCWCMTCPVLRLAQGRFGEPSATVLDRRTLRFTPESGGRAAWDGHKRTRGAKLPMAVDRLGHLLALHVTPADADDRSAVETLALAVQDSQSSALVLAIEGRFLLTLSETGDGLVLTFGETGLTLTETHSQSAA